MVKLKSTNQQNSFIYCSINSSLVFDWSSKPIKQCLARLSEVALLKYMCEISVVPWQVKREQTRISKSWIFMSATSSGVRLILPYFIISICGTNISHLWMDMWISLSLVTCRAQKISISMHSCHRYISSYSSPTKDKIIFRFRLYVIIKKVLVSGKASVCPKKLSVVYIS